MKSDAGIAQAQTQSLLDRLQREREKIGNEIEQQTSEQCAWLTASARRRARERIAQAVAEAREHNETRLALIRAALQTRARHRHHHRQLRLIETGRKVLRQSLESRWQQPENRREWCLALLHRAGSLLHQFDWLLRHADGLAKDERQQLTAAAAEFGGTLSFELDTALGSGAILVAGPASIDASAANLCRPSPELDAALLAALAEFEDR